MDAFKLVITVVEGIELSLAVAIPTIQVQFSSKKKKTKSKPANKTNPLWNETFELSYEEGNAEMVVRLLDGTHRGFSKKVLGQTVVLLKDLSAVNVEKEFVQDLVDSKNTPLGKIKIRIKIAQGPASKARTVAPPPFPSSKPKPRGTKSGRSVSQQRLNPTSNTPAIFDFIRHRNIAGLEEFLRTADPSQVNAQLPRTKNTPLHESCIEREEAILRLLLNFPGIDVNVNNFDDTTPLHYFCEKWQSPDLACFHLFIKQGANVNAINSNGETPIFKAIFNNSIRYILLEALIKNNADVNITTKTAREGVLHYAVRLGRADLVSLILQAVPRLDLKGEEGYTPEELARVYNQQKIANQLKQVGELFKWLEENDISEMKGIFLKNDITLSLLPDMNDQLLKQMGIESIGMRLKIIKACEKVDNVSYNHPELLKKEDSFRNHGLDLLEKNLRGLDSSGEGLIQDGKIEYIKLLGSGASGDVWLGLYNQVEKVAVKVLKEDTGEKDMEEFQKEFEVLRAVSNEHVVRFYGAATKPRLSMVMEYCSRGSLYHVLKDTKVEIDWRRAVAFCRDTCEGLRALHNNNPQILHRDLKSLNLLVSEDWKVKLCDFGLSRFATPDNLQTMQKMRGTFAYCDPEIYNGKSFTSASDMYSLGIIIWEIVNRVMKGVYEQPYSEFKSITFDFDIIHKAAKEDLRPTIPPGCPPIFAEMISLLTHKSQSSRLTLPTLKGKLDEIEEAMKTNPQFV